METFQLTPDPAHKPRTIQKMARAIALILRLSGSVATRKTVAMENASNAGMMEVVAVRLMEKLAIKEASA